MSIADLIVPNPYPLNVGAITSPNITTDNLTVNVSAQMNGSFATANGATIATASPIVTPLSIDSPAGALSTGLRVRVGGVTYGIFSANGATNHIDLGSPAGSTAALGLFTAGTERLRIANAGVAVNTSTVSALALAAGDPTIYAMPMSSSGAFASTWVSLVGFAPAPTVVNIQYIRVGDVVSCQLTAYSTTLAVGSNTARISLPVARAGNFTGVDEECSGDLFANGAAGTFECIIEPVPGTTNEGLITLENGLVGAVTLRGSFSYRLSP